MSTESRWTATRNHLRDRILDHVTARIQQRKEAHRVALNDLTDVPHPCRAGRCRHRRHGCPAEWAHRLATIPAELVVNLNRTTDLVVDTALAYGTEDHVDARLVLELAFADDTGLIGGIFAEDSGSTGDLLKKAGKYGGRKLAVRLARMVLGRMVPIAGAAGAAIWAREHTLKVGHRARKHFQELAREAADTNDAPASSESGATPPTESSAGPVEIDASEAVRRERHALASSLLCAYDKPEKVQIEALDALADHLSVKGLPSAQACLQDGAPQLNLPLLAEIELEILTDELSTVASHRPVPADWVQQTAPLLGLTDDALATALGARLAS